MSTDKSFWAWGEEANQQLKSLTEMAVRANLEAGEHLQLLAIRLVQAKLKSEKYHLHGEIIGIVVEPAIMYYDSKKPEGSPSSDVAVKTANDWQKTSVKIAQVMARAQEIIDSIPSMKISELYQLIEDIMNKKPIFETQPKVIEAIGIPRNPKLKIYFAKGVPVDSHPPESKQSTSHDSNH